MNGNASDISGDDLTTIADSDITPTAPSFGAHQELEESTIQALYDAATDAAYDLAVARIPSDNRIKVKGINYVKYDPYRSKRSKRSAWYWAPSQSLELIRTTKGRIATSSAELRNRRFWKCHHCNEIQSADANSKNKENHLTTHGISKHGNKTPRAVITPFARRDTSTAPESLRQSQSFVNLTTSVLLQPFKEALIALLVICQLAFNLVTSELFCDLLCTLYPMINKILPRSGNTIRNWVIEAYKTHKEKQKVFISKAKSKINFSFDLWTSPNNLALIGMVAHYIDEYGQMKSNLIAIRRLLGNHTGENQAQLLIRVINEDYDIPQDNIGFFVTDNAANNDTCIDAVMAAFFPNMPPHQRLQRRLRDLGHVINIAAKAFLYGTEYDAFECDVNSVREQSDMEKELKLLADCTILLSSLCVRLNVENVSQLFMEALWMGNLAISII